MTLLFRHERRYITKKWAPLIPSLDGGRKYSFSVTRKGDGTTVISISRQVDRSEHGPMIVEPDRFTESAYCVELQWNEY